ncbi:MAG: cation:proton antiporter [Actinomycetales bacterium]|jgi:cell volume regulation protein A|nr:cation:proton antiporter [Candidatus Lutibacillus vidarii]HON75680.1 cation:proton antiporter [Dermatophilaceae bacterium]HRB98728.1 cation:proton antiporter [Dermatophilaceae bacterium]
MDDVVGYAALVLLVSLAGLAAVWANRLSERLSVPAPALFLVGGALLAQAIPAVGAVRVLSVQRIVTVMLVVLLFDGGMHIGWRRFRQSSGAIIWLGVLGTLVTTLGVAAVAHLLFGFDWLSALLLGVALSPTDPAVVFSVLGRREIAGRSGTILEGESGANDPVGIAAMAALLAATGAHGGAAAPTGLAAVGAGAWEFALQMVIGAAVGLLGGRVLSFLMRRVPLPTAALYPIRTLLVAGVIFGLGTVLHGSGFLAVFIAGIVVGDTRAPYKAEIVRFHSSLASMAEMTAFGLLGMTVSVSALAAPRVWAVGLAIGVFAAVVVRPVLVGLLLLTVDLSRGERLFVMWAGLKGAVPILLGTYLLSASVAEPTRLYQIVVVVVVFSVIVQGGSVPYAARRLGVPMHLREPEPWSLGVRLREEPSSVVRRVVAPGSAADGAALDDLDLGGDAWVSLVVRDGAVLPPRGETPLLAGDQVLVLVEPESPPDLDAVFGLSEG